MSATLGKRVRDAERVVVTANRLRDGAVVWRGQEGGWTIHFGEAVVFDAPEVAAALAAAKRDEVGRLVVGSYATPVVAQEAGLAPVGWKERIRAAGPTIDVPGGLHGQG